MRLWSWNVNGIRACHRKGQLLSLLEREKPDVLCLQEIKAMPEQLEHDLLESHGYHVSWAPAEKKGYSGVATFSKHAPDRVQIGIGEARFDQEGRVLISDHGPLTVVNCYFPNGQRDHARLPYKTDFYRTLLSWGAEQRSAGRELVICGDWNTAHQEMDLKNWKTNRKTSGFTDFERSLIDEFIEQGWHDSIRTLRMSIVGGQTEPVSETEILVGELITTSSQTSSGRGWWMQKCI